MAARITPCLVCLFLVLIALVSAAQMGGGPLPVDPPTGSCVSPADQARMAAAIERYLVEPGPLSSPRDVQKLPFFPMAGNPGEDLMATNYVDLLSGPGLRDWRCTTYTYEGHDATDAIIRTFDEQDVGVPVYAVLDGRVVTTVDGHFDKQTRWTNAQANYVIIDHGNGLFGRYLHFRKGSISVQPNQLVKAGQQIALTGSSGRSTWPHLHFATYLASNVVEPHAGACNSGPVGWVRQPPWKHSFHIYDLAITNQDVSKLPPLPNPFPRGGQMAFTDRFFYLWILAGSLPAQSTWRIVVKRPNQSVAFDSGTRSFGNPFYSLSWWYWFYDIRDMHRIAGTWRIRLDINGSTAADAPVAVASTYPGLNRAPEPVTAAFDPAPPVATDPIACRVSAPMVVDDRDYDVVRYRYEWKVNQATVRDVTSAGRADAIAVGVALGGEIVECKVTPSDGKAGGPPVSVSARVQPSPWTDLGFGKTGTNGVPVLDGIGSLVANRPIAVEVSRGYPGSIGLLAISPFRGDVPFLGGTLVPFPVTYLLPLPLDGNGKFTLSLVWPVGLPSGTVYYLQCWIPDPGASFGIAATNALSARLP